jgi:hypothetical protein
MRPYVRPDRFPVEFHVTIPALGRRSAAVTPELWRDASSLPGRVPLRCLSSAHFILHSSLHYLADLDGGDGALKGLRDVMRVLRHGGAGIGWQDFWTTARRWEVGDETATVLATLREYWGVSVPGLPEAARPLPARRMIDGDPAAAEHLAAHRFRDYLRTVAAARQLPGLPARLRYLRVLVFPSPEKLRYWYGIPDSAALWPYYLRRPFRLLGRIPSGLWAAARRQLAHPTPTGTRGAGDHR